MLWPPVASSLPFHPQHSTWSQVCECMTAPGPPESPTELHIASLTPSSLELAWKVCTWASSPAGSKADLR